MEQSAANQPETPPALDRIETALARMAAALKKAEAGRLAQAAETVRIEVDNERLREAVSEAIGQIDALIARAGGDTGV